MSLFCNAPECNARHVFPRIHIQEILSHLRVIVQHYKCSNFIFEVKVSLTITRFIAGLLTLQKYSIDLIYELSSTLALYILYHSWKSKHMSFKKNCLHVTVTQDILFNFRIVKWNKVWGDMKYLNMTKTDVGNAHYPNYRKMHILEILNVCHLLLLSM